MPRYIVTLDKDQPGNPRQYCVLDAGDVGEAQRLGETAFNLAPGYRRQIQSRELGTIHTLEELKAVLGIR